MSSRRITQPLFNVLVSQRANTGSPAVTVQPIATPHPTPSTSRGAGELRVWDRLRRIVTFTAFINCVSTKGKK
ncbi:hypothetical protein NDU88_001924 [Pleurodeles waltl]|uniref:Uncharacterized protein n=1 Tax=Pleurodeles waltl TaxID=8319 RepID=A0AAV7R8I6_PLEWA|nr:hypothetical protein NDU88_001924 [Pleurodeles waltl]